MELSANWKKFFLENFFDFVNLRNILPMLLGAWKALISAITSLINWLTKCAQLMERGIFPQSVHILPTNLPTISWANTYQPFPPFDYADGYLKEHKKKWYQNALFGVWQCQTRAFFMISLFFKFCTKKCRFCTSEFDKNWMNMYNFT